MTKKLQLAVLIVMVAIGTAPTLTAGQTPPDAAGIAPSLWPYSLRLGSDCGLPYVIAEVRGADVYMYVCEGTS